jgi:hypothetical protein
VRQVPSAINGVGKQTSTTISQVNKVPISPDIISMATLIIRIYVRKVSSVINGVGAQTISEISQVNEVTGRRAALGSRAAGRRCTAGRRRAALGSRAAGRRCTARCRNQPWCYPPRPDAIACAKVALTTLIIINLAQGCTVKRISAQTVIAVSHVNVGSISPDVSSFIIIGVTMTYRIYPVQGRTAKKINVQTAKAVSHVNVGSISPDTNGMILYWRLPRIIRIDELQGCAVERVNAQPCYTACHVNVGSISPDTKSQTWRPECACPVVRIDERQVPVCS